ncbi:MAG: type 1 glutamine amidotransferase domain-containing protein [Thermoleophilia bacterium]
MSDEIQGKRIAFLAADGVERVELVRPWEAVEAAGGVPSLISLEGGSIRSFDHLDPSEEFTVDLTAADADAAGFDGLVLPGGVANPDVLRIDPDVQRLVRDFFDQQKPVAVICHGPWTLIDAGVVDGRTITSWPTLRTDLTNAGANWVDEEVHVDNGLVSSRKPDDLPAFCAKMIEEFAEGRHAEQAA